MSEWSDKFEDTKGVITSYESKKDSQYNYQAKLVNNTNNDLQITKQKTKKIEQHEHHKKKTSVISGFLEWKAVPAPPVAKTRLDHRNVGPVQIRHHHHLIKIQINLAI